MLQVIAVVGGVIGVLGFIQLLIVLAMGAGSLPQIRRRSKRYFRKQFVIVFLFASILFILVFEGLFVFAFFSSGKPEKQTIENFLIVGGEHESFAAPGNAPSIHPRRLAG